MKLSPPTSVGESLAADNKPGSPHAPALGDAGDLFKTMLSQISRAQQQADGQIQKALAGKGELHDAMLSLENANLGLKFLVQVRNKLLQAYEELSRMSI